MLSWILLEESSWLDPIGSAVLRSSFSIEPLDREKTERLRELEHEKVSRRANAREWKERGWEGGARLWLLQCSPCVIECSVEVWATRLRFDRPVQAFAHDCALHLQTALFVEAISLKPSEGFERTRCTPSPRTSCPPSNERGQTCRSSSHEPCTSHLTKTKMFGLIRVLSAEFKKGSG